MRSNCGVFLRLQSAHSDGVFKQQLTKINKFVLPYFTYSKMQGDLWNSDTIFFNFMRDYQNSSLVICRNWRLERDFAILHLGILKGFNSFRE